MLSNPSLCAQCTVKQTNQNVRVWSRDRFVARVEQGEHGSSYSKVPDSLMGYREEFLRGR